MFFGYKQHYANGVYYMYKGSIFSWFLQENLVKKNKNSDFFLKKIK